MPLEILYKYLSNKLNIEVLIVNEISYVCYNSTLLALAYSSHQGESWVVTATVLYLQYASDAYMQSTVLL